MKSYYLSPFLHILLFLTFSYCLLYGHPIVELNQPSVHQEHIGKIRFTETAVQEGQVELANFLSQYVFTNKSNLFITVSLVKPLTDFLRPLAPNLSADSLVKIGNYQFSFYVDNQLVYQINLIPGAPTPAQ